VPEQCKQANLVRFAAPPVDNIFGKHFYYLVKILGKVGQNMTTPLNVVFNQF
jgi:hypothetical protein